MGFGSGGSSFGSGAGDIAGNLSVTGTATITGDLTVDTNTLFVDASANGPRVGIGTTSPLSALHLVTPSSHCSITLKRSEKGAGDVGLNLEGGTGGGIWYIIQQGTSDNLTFFESNGDAARVTFESGGNVGIGTASPNANAILDLTSTTKPFMPPRMTEAERDAVSGPTAGMVIYNSTTNVLNFHNGSAWGAV